MTAKFIPFDPNTAKNGDIVYGILSGDTYKYVGNDPINSEASILYDCAASKYVWCSNEHLQIKQPMKTVWINMYSNGNKMAYWYDTEETAKKCKSEENWMGYIGTFPLEVPA